MTSRAEMATRHARAHARHRFPSMAVCIAWVLARAGNPAARRPARVRWCCCRVYLYILKIHFYEIRYILFFNVILLNLFLLDIDRP